MEKPADTRKSSDWRAKPGKTLERISLERINMVEKCEAEPRGAPRVLIPRPGENLLQVC